MCGIVGILGKHQVAPLLLEALKRMEYRGYDSAGIATVRDGQLERRRAEGKLIHLSDVLVHAPLAGHIGIGHTRWATHGAPIEANAHPHLIGKVSVVHNGIIENFRELKEEVLAQGAALVSDTDTEIVAALVELAIRDGASPQDAVSQVLPRLKGAYALAFLFEGEEDLMIGARMGSPLAVGLGEGEMYLGSDAIALSNLSSELIYLEDGDWVVLSRDNATIFDLSGAEVSRAAVQVSADQTQVDKQGHKHFMSKEMFEQPTVLSEVVQAYSSVGSAARSEIFDGLFDGIERVLILACGTASLAGKVAKYWIEDLSGLPVDIDIASEYRYRNAPISSGTLAIFVSQSGETADTLAALRYVKGKAKRCVGLTNVTTSTIARLVDINMPILAGPEIGVASTKAFTAQLTMLMILALRAAETRGTLSPDALQKHWAALQTLPGLVSQALLVNNACEVIAQQLADVQHALYLGRGPMYPLAEEAALKLKEISYIHAEGYAAGELKHGPIALVDPTMPVIVLAPCDALFDKTVSNMQEVMARGGRVIMVSDEAGIAEAGDGTAAVLAMPKVDPLLAPIVYSIPVQLIAYHTSILKGTDVDQPRNLAKSVTVE